MRRGDLIEYADDFMLQLQSRAEVESIAEEFKLLESSWQLKINIKKS